MKKIIILTAIIVLVLTDLSFAAQKTITKYMRAGDMGIHMPLNPGDFVPNPSDPRALTGNLVDNNLSMGNNINDVSGSYIYGGDSDIAYCVAGKCIFGIGVRVYFEFTFQDTDTSSDSTAQADGFTFTIFNGSNNTKNSTGGAPAGISMGELIGYAGPGRTDGLGLQPPKMAIEFDTFPNTGSTDICAANSRNDADNNNHMALMFWGDNLTGNCTISGTDYPKTTFDDNKHGAGTVDNPVNSSKGDGLGGYYAGAKNGSYNWLEDAQLHSFRMEITRATAPVSGKYAYNIKTWVDCPGCTADQLKTFKDLTVPYNNESLSPKRINRTVSLVEADHQAFNTMLFGWTFATGGSTQRTSIQNFDLYFPKSSCGYGTNPASASLSSAAQSGNITVLATVGCPWTAVSDSITWLTIPSGSGNGTGNGTVTYNVTANTGTVRTGNITIGDQVFTVTQANGCTYAINPTIRAHTYSAAAGQTVAVTAGTGCTWTAVSNNAWITVTGGASGTGNGTVTYSITANTGAARSGTITIGSQTFTVNQAIGLPTCMLTAGANIVPYNGTKTLTWSVTNSPTSASWTTSPGGTCGSPNPAGGSCTTAAQTTAGARTYNLTVINASGSSTCSNSPFYVGCAGYTVYNNTGSRRDFMVTGSACRRVNSGSAIPDALNPGDTVTRYSTNNTTCGTAQGSFNYTAAMNADIVANGGNGGCTVNYNSNDTVSDR